MVLEIKLTFDKYYCIYYTLLNNFVKHMRQPNRQESTQLVLLHTGETSASTSAVRLISWASQNERVTSLHQCHIIHNERNACILAPLADALITFLHGTAFLCLQQCYVFQLPWIYGSIQLHSWGCVSNSYLLIHTSSVEAVPFLTFPYFYHVVARYPLTFSLLQLCSFWLENSNSISFFTLFRVSSPFLLLLWLPSYCPASVTCRSTCFLCFVFSWLASRLLRPPSQFVVIMLPLVSDVWVAWHRLTSRDWWCHQLVFGSCRLWRYMHGRPWKIRLSIMYLHFMCSLAITAQPAVDFGLPVVQVCCTCSVLKSSLAQRLLYLWRYMAVDDHDGTQCHIFTYFSLITKQNTQYCFKFCI